MYRDWEDSQLECVTHEEAVESGSIIEVQARLSSAGDTQLFIGVYSSDGVAVIEIAYDSRPGEAVTEALAWGVAKARGFVSLESTLRPEQSA